jgi:hypothetical protein
VAAITIKNRIIPEDIKMLKISFSAILLTAGLACVANAAVLQDDPGTYALWHADTIAGSTTLTSPDDTSISLRSANPLTITAAAGSFSSSTGEYGQSLDFGTDGRKQGTTGTAWSVNTATGDGQDIKVDGWFYIPTAACLPIPTTAGGTGAATVYTFQISTSSAGGTNCYLAINPYYPSSGPWQARLEWQHTNAVSGSPAAVTVRLPIYNYNKTNGQAYEDGNSLAMNLTGKWLHVVAYTQYASPAPSWDPNYNRVQLNITDSSTNTTYSTWTASTRALSGSGTTIWVGQISGKAGDTPYRGWRGKIDELKVSKRSHAYMMAYAPTPATGSTVSPNANQPVTWYAAAPFNPADSVTYDVWKGPYATFSASDPNWTKVATGVTGTSANLGAVVFGKTYYWKVDAIDSAGGTPVTRASAIWSFNVNDIAPVVDLGSDVITYLVGGTRTLAMTPTVTDVDTDLGLLTYQWAQIGAAPAMSIASPTAKNTNIVFNQAGTYYFQLTANDGTFGASDIVKVQVFSSACDAAKALATFSAKSGDINSDCHVTFIDFAQLAANYQKCASLDPACN